MMENSAVGIKEAALIQNIKNYRNTGIAATTKLETDEKVLARVTDGIYRLPGSALRELITNAYDADAETVSIDTDVPRFQTITVRDDGNGMSVETLVNLLNHVGASAKRSSKGKELEVTDKSDSSLSLNKKRKIIGKIGIGLFSVAQLTRDFDIVTKQAGDDFYLKAKVRLHNYSEEYIQDVENKLKTQSNSDLNSRGASFETGKVEIWTEQTDNVDAHGTDIILRNIKKSARDQLRSIDIWGQESAEESLEAEKNSEDILNSSKLEKPTFHVGNYFGLEGYEYYDDERKPNLPWDPNDPEEKKFEKLYDAILSLTKITTNPKLNIVLDSYLNMLWVLSLSVPLDYIDKHPFKYSADELKEVYVISNKLKAQCIELKEKGEIANILPAPRLYGDVGFKVVVDGVQLFRPMKFKGLPQSAAVLKDPILFIGSYSPDLSSLEAKDSGGALSFDAYILWAPKVIPREHNGSLIRVNNASGTLFDETFMKHQVAEHTIKSQLSIEIFVNKGLDSALNIDRESFNVSHPHYQIIMKWLHQAIRQAVYRYKNLKKLALATKVELKDNNIHTGVSGIVRNSPGNFGRDYSELSNLYLVDGAKATSTRKQSFKTSDLPMESVRIDRSRFITLSGLTSSTSSKLHTIEVKTEAIIQLLDGYGLLSNLSASQRESLIEDVIQVLGFEG